MGILVRVIHRGPHDHGLIPSLRIEHQTDTSPPALCFRANRKYKSYDLPKGPVTGHRNHSARSWVNVCGLPMSPVVAHGLVM